MAETPDTALLEGTTVVEIGSEPVQAAGRLLAELGAAVTVIEPRYVDHLRERGWGHGKTVTSAADGTFAIDGGLQGDVVVASLEGFEEARVTRADASRITLLIVGGGLSGTSAALAQTVNAQEVVFVVKFQHTVVQKTMCFAVALEVTQYAS